MDAVFFLTHNQFGISPEQKILKAKEYAVFYDASMVLEEAKQRAHQIISESKEEYVRMQRLGYEAGVEEGKLELAGKMIEQVAASVEYFASVEGTVVDVVTTALEKIIGKMDDKERIVSVVHKALSYVRTQKKVLVRIAPEDVPFIQESLNDLVRTYPGITFLDVEPDTNLSRGDCVLESEMGIVNASINLQIDAIRRSFLKHLQNKTTHATITTE